MQSTHRTAHLTNGTSSAGLPDSLMGCLLLPGSRRKNVKRLLAGLVSMLVLSVLTACSESPAGLSDNDGAPVLAANPHFLRGPDFTDVGTQLRATGTIAGLGNEDIDVILTARGTTTVTCTNPAGNVAPGQTKTITVSGSDTNIEVKNGKATFSVTTAEPTAPAGSCPNPKWTASITDVTFTSATLTVIQPSGSGNVVFEQTFSGPF
jgi:hypothetical protein